MLNGSFIGNHEGCFQPCHFNVTDQLNFKKSDQLIVKEFQVSELIKFGL